MLSGKEILTIGCNFTPPKGGIACVLDVYKRKVYEHFRFVANSCEGSVLRKLWMVVKSYLQCEWQERFDKDVKIVHIHTASYNSFKRSVIYLKQAKRHGKKVVMHIHGGGFREYRKSCPEFVDKHLGMCDAIVALSETWRKYFAEELGFNNVYVVNNVIDNPKIVEKKKDGKFHLLFLGLITEAKGIFDLLEVLKEHKEEWSGHLVLHVGGNGKVSELNQMIEAFGVGDMVIFEEWVSGDKKSELLSMADAFILPSYTEGVPISILESMSYGVPILSTPVGGIPEVVNADTGILFTPGDRVAMAKAINHVKDGENLRRNMGIKSLEVAKLYMTGNITIQLKRIYDLF